MICLLGSSFSRGAQGAEHKQWDTYIHNMLSAELGMPVINLSMSGHGSETYSDAYVYACAKHRPRLIVAEVWVDRTFCHLWLPTRYTKMASQQSVDDIYDGQFAESVNDGGEFDWKHMWLHKVFRHDQPDAPTLETFRTSAIQKHDLHELLQMYETIGVYADHDWPLQLRTIRRLQNLEAVSQLVGVPVLWWTYLDRPTFRPFTDSLPTERHLNAWAGIRSGTCEWAEQQLGGQHLADGWHLNSRADRLVQQQLMAPWIRAWLETH